MTVDGIQMVDSENIHGAESSAYPAALPSSSDVSAGLEKGDIIASACMQHEVEVIESEIPGLASSTHTNGQSETAAASSLESTDVEANSQEQDTGLAGKPPLEISPSLSNDRSEEHSPKPVVMDGNISFISTAMSAGLSYHVVLPKMAAPVVHLPDDQQDHLQKLAFARIIEAYKDVEVAGGSKARSSLLSYMGVEVMIFGSWWDSCFPSNFEFVHSKHLWPQKDNTLKHLLCLYSSIFYTAYLCLGIKRFNFATLRNWSVHYFV